MSDLNNDAREKMVKLIDEAKTHKAAMDEARLEYKHVMKKLDVWVVRFPDLAKQLGINEEPKAEVTSGTAAAAPAAAADKKADKKA